MALTLNPTPHTVADMDGVEWQHSWMPSCEHETEVVLRLPALQRLLLTTDVTMMTALGALMEEPIAVWLLDQWLHTLDYDDDELQLEVGRKALIRKVLLYGSSSGTPLLFGSSRTVLSRLSSAARRTLLSGEVPIGLMLRSHRIETFRTPLSVGVKPASGEATALLGAGLMCQRTYAIESAGWPLTVVHEEFPAAGFTLASSRAG